MAFLIVIVALFALLWLFLIRPQRRRQLQQQEMQNSLRLGDEIITAGGMHAYIRALDEDVITIEIAPNTNVRLDRRAVAGVVRPELPESLAEEPVETAAEEESEPISRSES